MRFSADWWAFWGGVWAVGLTVAAALAGLVAWSASLITAKAAEERQQALELAVGQQTERAAKAEKDLFELKERARPRSLDTQAKTILLERLSIGQHAAPVLVEYVGGSTNEPSGLAQQLHDTLKEAGWPVSGLTGGPMFGNPPSGLVVRISDVGGVDEQAGALMASLEAAGFACKLGKARNFKPGTISLLVGLKP